MNTNIKADLKRYYDLDAARRDASKKQPWKMAQREGFLRRLASEGKTSLLEIGAGTGADSLFFQEHGLRVVAVDLSGEMVSRCREKGLEASELDFYQLGSLHRTFDAVYSMNSLLHVPKAELSRVLREVGAVLAKGGLFYLGLYGGADDVWEQQNEAEGTRRFFFFHSPETLREALRAEFSIEADEAFEVEPGLGFLAFTLRKE